MIKIKNISQARKLFLIDGAGALISAFFLGIVLVKFESFFGIPKATLYFLAFIPCLFFVYDLFSYRQPETKIGLYLKGIAFLNLSYAVLSLSLAFYHSSVVTIYGWIYVINEILIILVLAKIEYNAGNITSTS